MALLAKEGGVTFDPIPEGVHQAICYAVYDLGTQFSEKWEKRARKALVVWELPDERIEIEKDGQKKNLPRASSKQYTLSLNEKSNLRKDLQSWRGRAFTPEELGGFDLQKLLGKNCMIQIIHTSKDGKTYANISAILPLMKNMQAREAENPIQYYSIEEHGFNIPEGTPKWVHDIILASEEFGQAHGTDDYTPVDEDVPF